MKNKKGFTLIELLAVIVILGIILTIAGTSVFNAINKSKENVKFAAAKEIVEIADAYFAENSDKDFVTVSELISEGYLEKDATNPRTGKNGGMESGKPDQYITITKNASVTEQPDNSLTNYNNRTYGYNLDGYSIIVSDNGGKKRVNPLVSPFKGYYCELIYQGFDEDTGEYYTSLGACYLSNNTLNDIQKQEFIAYKIAYYIRQVIKSDERFSYAAHTDNNTLCYKLNASAISGSTTTFATYVLSALTTFKLISNDDVKFYNENEISKNASVCFPEGNFNVNDNKWEGYNAFRFKIDETKGDDENQKIFVYTYDTNENN